jgi:hypothetical protein
MLSSSFSSVPNSEPQPIHRMKSLLSIDTNAKTVKGQKRGFMTGILYLAPDRISGLFNACPNASNGCRNLCLYFAGRGAFNSVQKARIAKTVHYVKDRETFLATLTENVAMVIRKAKTKRMTPVIRLNGTSDIGWERYTVIQAFKTTRFYDYTKSFARMVAFLDGKLPSNYSLTFSRSEANESQCIEILRRGGNVAVVFRGKVLPTNWQGFPVINGDENDLRFLDPKGVVVGLTAKGKAKTDTSGFVVG